MEWFFFLASQGWFWIFLILLAGLIIQWRWRRDLSGPMAGAVIGVSLLAFFVSSSFWLATTQNVRLALVTPRSSSLAEDVKNKLEAYEKRADDLEKLLSLLVAVTAVYGIALGVNAYAQAKESQTSLDKIRGEAVRHAAQSSVKLSRIENEARREADKFHAEIGQILNDTQTKVDGARGEVEGFVRKIETRFPLLADMDIRIRSMVAQILPLFPVIDINEENYKRLQPGEKQQILYYEKALAGLEPFDLRQVSREASEGFHALGNFYGQKYQTEKEECKTDPHKPIANEDDKERSRYYLDRALLLDRSNVGALNDRVFFAANIDPNDQEYKKGEHLCNESLEFDPKQQRARYNLAYLEHRKKNYHRSEELLTEALGKASWQHGRRAKHRFSILYNRACARARLGDFGQALLDLEGAFPTTLPTDPHEIEDFLADISMLKESFADDIEPSSAQHPEGGDLSTLFESTAYRQKMETIADRVRRY